MISNIFIQSQKGDLKNISFTVYKTEIEELKIKQKYNIKSSFIKPHV